MLTDTHCHLYYDSIKKDIQTVLARAKEQGVNRFICVGTNLDDSKECQILSEQHENVFFSAGIHPHDSKNVSKKYLQHLRNFNQYDKMVAVGEMGLDYFRNFSPKDSQVKVFREQLELAQQVNKPVIFHNRDADKDVIKILSEFPGVVGVAHCFSSDLKTAKVFLDMGFYISFSGNLTFKNSHLPEIAKEIPLDKVMIETDSPFLSPVPFRGKPNEPGRTRFVAEKLAEIHKLPLEKIAEKTSTNAATLFSLPKLSY
tara:strand:- start:130 stop:900 length:771 start_codon:yes stop_codon:yes gene_type:complete